MKNREGTWRFELLKPLRGLLLANIAVLFFGLAGVLGKLSNLPAPLIVFGRASLAGIVLLLACWFQHSSLRPKRARDGLLLLGQGALLALHWTAFFQSINVSNVAIGLLSYSSFPLFTAALEPLLLHRRPSCVQIIAAICILGGIYLLVPSFTLQDTTTVGVAWGVLSGATFALLSVTNLWLGRTYSSLMISFYQNGTAAVVLLPIFFLIGPGVLWTPQKLLLLLMIGVVCTALAHTLFISSMRTLTAQTASLIASLEPVWGIIFGIFLLGSIPTGRTILGGVIILAATLLPGIVAIISSPARNRRNHHSA
ncbi:membrane protein [Dictyobacter sp. S3.2.2.5]|uniref:Membrane protein n=1 Tax=Dictyobacter halimunensis TaxID=3026934 RepID=A0ABQ6FZV5_9CHLR|nr:membrane protein [Dictyobacter sp. S3.2.2.5]